MPDTVQVLHMSLRLAARRLGELVEPVEGHPDSIRTYSSVGELSGAVMALSIASETLTTWEDRGVRDEAFADAIDAVLNSGLPLDVARMRLAKVADDLRDRLDGPDRFEEARS